MSESLSGGTGRLQQHESSPTVKDEARGVADETATSAKAVGGVAKNEAANVAHEAKSQAKDLLSQSREELMEQASHQQARAAEGLHALHRQLHSMASNSEEQGVGTDLVHQAAGRTEAFADWLDHRDPGSVIEEVKRYARRRPGMFLAIAAGAGLVAGRLSRSLGANANDDEAHDTVPPRPATPPTSAAYAADGDYATEPAYAPEPGYTSESGYLGEPGYTGASHPEGAGYAPAPSSPSGAGWANEGAGYAPGTVSPTPYTAGGGYPADGRQPADSRFPEATPGRGSGTNALPEDTDLDGLLRPQRVNDEHRVSDDETSMTGRRAAPHPDDRPGEPR